MRILTLLVVLSLATPCYADLETFSNNIRYVNSRIPNITKEEVFEIMGEPSAVGDTLCTYFLPESAMVRYEFFFKGNILQEIKCFTITNSPVHDIPHDFEEFLE